MPQRSGRVVALVVLQSVLAVLVLGVLTFGVQATAAPDGVPLAVSVSAPQLDPVAQRVAGQSGGRVAWQVLDPGTARDRLADAEVYGVLELAPAPGGGVAPTVLLSGAVNPSGTQVAQQALTGAAQAVAAAVPGSAPPRVVTVDEASAAGRIAPLAASALLWLGTLGASLLLRLGLRGTGGPRVGARLATALGAGAAAALAVFGLLALWDSGMGLGYGVLGMLVLMGVTFAAMQGAVLRLLGFAGMAVLAPLYLIAPSVAGQVPELLHPAYRAALWSWSPFRFSTEGLRGLLQLDGLPPAAVTAGWVFISMAVLGLVVLAWPDRRAPGSVQGEADAEPEQRGPRGSGPRTRRPVTGSV